MSFQSATTQSPADADLIAYRGPGAWTVIRRRSDGIFESIANCDRTALDLIIAGASASRKSVWNYETGQFEVGTVEQLSRQPQEA